MLSDEVFKLSKLILLRKQRSEFLFKKNYLLWKGSTNNILISSIESEILQIEKEIGQLEKRFNGMEIIFPDDRKIKELDLRLKNMSDEDIFSAMQTKDGEAYEIIKEKSELMKNTYKNSADVAQINLIIGNLKENERKIVISLLADKENFSYDLMLSKIKDERLLKNLTLLFSRLEFDIPENQISLSEKKINIGQRALWVPNEKADEIAEICRNAEEMSKKIQLWNAQRQIKKFTEKEEQDFAKIQQEYLDLLKEKDIIIEKFSSL
ncbi:MAG: hypothetical protein WC501_02990 [Candidatus Micrarchaeia archaeon]